VSEGETRLQCLGILRRGGGQRTQSGSLQVQGSGLLRVRGQCCGEPVPAGEARSSPSRVPPFARMLLACPTPLCASGLMARCALARCSRYMSVDPSDIHTANNSVVHWDGKVWSI